MQGLFDDTILVYSLVRSLSHPATDNPQVRAWIKSNVMIMQLIRKREELKEKTKDRNRK